MSQVPLKIKSWARASSFFSPSVSLLKSGLSRRILFELMTSDCKLKASSEGSK